MLFELTVSVERRRLIDPGPGPGLAPLLVLELAMAVYGGGGDAHRLNC